MKDISYSFILLFVEAVNPTHWILDLQVFQMINPVLSGCRDNCFVFIRQTSLMFLAWALFLVVVPLVKSSININGSNPSPPLPYSNTRWAAQYGLHIGYERNHDNQEPESLELFLSRNRNLPRKSIFHQTKNQNLNQEQNHEC